MWRLLTNQRRPSWWTTSIQYTMMRLILFPKVSLLLLISFHFISFHIISYHIISYHIISYHIISYHIISYHIISYHIISYHVVSCENFSSYTISLDDIAAREQLMEILSLYCRVLMCYGFLRIRDLTRMCICI